MLGEFLPRSDWLWSLLRHLRPALLQILLEFRVVYKGRPLHACPTGGIGPCLGVSHFPVVVRLQLCIRPQTPAADGSVYALWPLPPAGYGLPHDRFFCYWPEVPQDRAYRTPIFSKLCQRWPCRCFLDLMRCKGGSGILSTLSTPIYEPILITMRSHRSSICCCIAPGSREPGCMRSPVAAHTCADCACSCHGSADLESVPRYILTRSPKLQRSAI